ncbi:hypothetical protein NDA18_001238 [Ustilago nuda]|nr:hypothetical protein NDA18_001238 [Ustilago nuda]
MSTMTPNLSPSRAPSEQIASSMKWSSHVHIPLGVPPTGKRLRIPMVGIVNLRGDKLAYGSLYWDQANALVQLGLLDPIKSSLKEGVKLPIAGEEVAQKILHPYGLPSNELMLNWSESQGKAIPASAAKSEASAAKSEASAAKSEASAAKSKT